MRKIKPNKGISLIFLIVIIVIFLLVMRDIISYAKKAKFE